MFLDELRRVGRRAQLRQRVEALKQRRVQLDDELVAAEGDALEDGVAVAATIDGSPLPLGLFATNPPLTRFAVNVALAFTTRLRTSALTFVVAVSASSRRVAAERLGPFREVVEQPFGERRTPTELDDVADACPSRPSESSARRPPDSELAAGVSIGRSLGLAIRPPIAAAFAWNKKCGLSFTEESSEGDSALLCHNLEGVLAVTD